MFLLLDCIESVTKTEMFHVLHPNHSLHEGERLGNHASPLYPDFGSQTDGQLLPRPNVLQARTVVPCYTLWRRHRAVDG